VLSSGPASARVAPTTRAHFPLLLSLASISLTRITYLHTAPAAIAAPIRPSSATPIRGAAPGTPAALARWQQYFVSAGSPAGAAEVLGSAGFVDAARTVMQVPAAAVAASSEVRAVLLCALQVRSRPLSLCVCVPCLMRRRRFAVC
jgi:hypothetical protein